MANQEHLDMLKQGVELWNQWREKYVYTAEEAIECNQEIVGALKRVDLTDAKLAGADLRGADLRDTIFSKATLRGVYLNGADLRGSDFSSAELLAAHLSGTKLSKAKLTNADLRGADLKSADLSGSDLSEADLSGADLRSADLSSVNLGMADLQRTDLTGVRFHRTQLTGTDFRGASIGDTVFGDTDLRKAKGLDEVSHRGPAIIGLDTIYRSKGNISEIFLKRAGVPDSFLTYMHSLTIQPIDYYTCFISYASRDQDFAERLYADLQSKSVRCWFAPEDLKIGDKFRPRIDESIRLYDKLLLVLSEYSLASQWVEQEVETALEKERRGHHMVLFPIQLDNAIMGIEGGWPALIRNTRHIGDFTQWKQYDTYQKALERLLRDLKTEIAQGKK